ADSLRAIERAFLLGACDDWIDLETLRAEHGELALYAIARAVLAGRERGDRRALFGARRPANIAADLLARAPDPALEYLGATLYAVEEKVPASAPAFAYAVIADHLRFGDLEDPKATFTPFAERAPVAAAPVLLEGLRWSKVAALAADRLVELGPAI